MSACVGVMFEALYCLFQVPQPKLQILELVANLLANLFDLFLRPPTFRRRTLLGDSFLRGSFLCRSFLYQGSPYIQIGFWLGRGPIVLTSFFSS
jgi:hypothetical protein